MGSRSYGYKPMLRVSNGRVQNFSRGPYQICDYRFNVDFVMSCLNILPASFMPKSNGFELKHLFVRKKGLIIHSSTDIFYFFTFFLVSNSALTRDVNSLQQWQCCRSDENENNRKHELSDKSKIIVFVLTDYMQPPSLWANISQTVNIATDDRWLQNGSLNAKILTPGHQSDSPRPATETTPRKKAAANGD